MERRDILDIKNFGTIENSNNRETGRNQKAREPEGETKTTHDKII